MVYSLCPGHGLIIYAFVGVARSLGTSANLVPGVGRGVESLIEHRYTLRGREVRVFPHGDHLAHTDGVGVLPVELDDH